MSALKWIAGLASILSLIGALLYSQDAPRLQPRSLEWEIRDTGLLIQEMRRDCEGDIAFWETELAKLKAEMQQAQPDGPDPEMPSAPPPGSVP